MSKSCGRDNVTYTVLNKYRHMCYDDSCYYLQHQNLSDFAAHLLLVVSVAFDCEICWNALCKNALSFAIY